MDVSVRLKISTNGKKINTIKALREVFGSPDPSGPHDGTQVGSLTFVKNFVEKYQETYVDVILTDAQLGRLYVIREELTGYGNPYFHFDDVKRIPRPVERIDLRK